MTFRTLRDLDVKGHRVFLRADLNVPLKDGVITDATGKVVLEQKNKVALIK